MTYLIKLIIIQTCLHIPIFILKPGKNFKKSNPSYLTCIVLSNISVQKIGLLLVLYLHIFNPPCVKSPYVLSSLCNTLYFFDFFMTYFLPRRNWVPMLVYLYIQSPLRLKSPWIFMYLILLGCKISIYSILPGYKLFIYLIFPGGKISIY